MFWSSSEFVAQSSSNPGNFLSDENHKGAFCYDNEVTWTHLRMGLVAWRINHLIQMFGIFGPTPSHHL